MKASALPYIDMALMAVAGIFVLLNIVPMMIWLERKASAFMQDRLGPNRATISLGPLKLRLIGMVHTIADMLKLLFKEDFIPSFAYKPYYLLAPALATAVPFTTFAVIPFASPDLFLGVPGLERLNFQVLNLSGGILWILAIASFSTFATMLAGWSSNNKFALFGSLRAGAQMVSYELTMSLSLVGIVLLAGSLEPQAIVKYQDTLLGGVLPRWGIFLQPVAFLLFLTSIFAETNRTPFDVAEGESEIVAGYHTEYGGMRFALFFMGEYASMAVASMLLVVLFLGGWSIPFFPTATLLAQPGRLGLFMGIAGCVPGLLVATAFFRIYRRRLTHPYWKDRRDNEALFLAGIIGVGALVLLFLGLACYRTVSGWPAWGGPALVAVFQCGFFLTKVMFFMFLFVWVRWTLPRFRYDQIMALGWKVMLPLALANLFVTALVIALKDIYAG